MRIAGVLLGKPKEPAPVGARVDTLNEHVKVIGHEAVRDYRDTRWLASAQDLRHGPLDDKSLAEQGLALKAAPSQEIAVRTDVVKIAKGCGVLGEHPGDGAGIAPAVVRLKPDTTLSQSG